MSSKWWLTLTVASLALNLVLVGFFVGRGASPIPGFDPTMRYPAWARTLPEERRSVLRPILHEHFTNVRPVMRELRFRHVELRDALVAEPFDQRRLVDALHGLRAGLLATQEHSHTAFVRFVAELSLEERQSLATDIMRPSRKRPGGARDQPP